jgi:hypothetical protein
MPTIEKGSKQRQSVVKKNLEISIPSDGYITQPEKNVQVSQNTKVEAPEPKRNYTVNEGHSKSTEEDMSFDAASNKNKHETSPSSLYRRDSVESEFLRVDDDAKSRQDTLMRRGSEDTEIERERQDTVINRGRSGTTQSANTDMRRGDDGSEQDEIERMSRRDDDVGTEMNFGGDDNTSQFTDQIRKINDEGMDYSERGSSYHAKGEFRGNFENNGEY